MVSINQYLALWLLVWPTQVFSQFHQDYTQGFSRNSAGKMTPIWWYLPTVSDPVIQVVDLAPTQKVRLVYNCFYMVAICQNARNWYNGFGANAHPNSGLTNLRFGYDFNTNSKKRGTFTRANGRGRVTCPSNWKSQPGNACPAFMQGSVWRNDGRWWSNALEPGTDKNEIIKSLTGAKSGIRYTCDEFPPKSWVEGGNGEVGAAPANTRCAAMRCMKGFKAEQDWQGTAHGKLRARLQSLTKGRLTEFPYFDSDKSIILFEFDMEFDSYSGVAARVLTLDTAGTMYNTIPVLQARQEEDFSNVTSQELPFVSIEEFEKQIKLGYGSQDVILADESASSWSDEDDDDDESASWGLQQDHQTFGYHNNGSYAETAASKVPREIRSILEHRVTPLLKRASSQDLADAKAIVANATAEASRLNKLRLAKPLRNTYELKPGTTAGITAISIANVTANQGVKRLLQITDKISNAAALVAESSGASRHVSKRAVASAGTYWMESIDRRGTVPWGDDTEYNVFRNVLQYGAVGDGVTDDTKAITAAMNNGTRCGKGCNGSTTKNAIVYFPPGTYLVSSTIPMPFGTQVIGDANDRPILLAAPQFIGLGVLSTDEYTGTKNADGSDGQWYVNTANFYRQIRNIVIDITETTTEGVACLHYQVAQATSLQNVELKAVAGSTQVGMYAENGSGGQISDVTFTGGGVGLYGGNQQFTAQRLTFNGCTIGVHVIWDWGWVWKSISMTNVGTGFKLVANDISGNIGSVSVLDSKFTNVKTVVEIAPYSVTPASGSTGVVLENVLLSGVTAAVADTTGAVLLDGSSAKIYEWALGPVYEGSTTARTFSEGGKVGNYQRHSTLLDSSGAYFERVKPQYEAAAVSDFVSVKALGAAGDGVTDDTAAFQGALNSAQGKILFVDAGSYILTSTLFIPPGSNIVGETWSQLVASGSYFEDASNPKVLIQVGAAGSIGNIEMQDLLFTTRGATAGLIVIEWNIQAQSPGSAGLWDCHVRIGGATGTDLTPQECPASTSGIDIGCSAASLMMHITPLASGYFENMWLWGADHMLDDPDTTDPDNEMVQCSIYVARGFLIESTHATWLYATASEHAVFYQYNFHGASDVFAGMIQTESPYFQPTPKPPAPFTDVVGVFDSDPDYSCTVGNDFSGCDESWSLIITESGNIFIAGAGVYSWFSTYSQTCIDTQKCQKALLLLNSNYANVRIQNLITIGAEYMAVMDGAGILAKDNLNVNSHPFWSQITLLDVGSDEPMFREVIWIAEEVWNMEQPTFTCLPPCVVQLPPWESVTSTVNYPLMTVSQGAWTSTITQAPLTISDYVFEIVTLTADNTNQRVKRDGQPFAKFIPTFATTPSWPSVIYTGIDGQTTMTAPSAPFPTPPPFIGKRAVWGITPVPGPENSPTANPCESWDLTCRPEPWIVGGNGAETSDTDDEGDDPMADENYDELQTTCPPTSSTTIQAPAPVTPIPIPVPIAIKVGHPSANKVKCYDSGVKADHSDLDTGVAYFCGQLELVNPYDYKYPPFELTLAPSIGNFVRAGITFKIIEETCGYIFNYNTCKKYITKIMDACDCEGVNGKQGGVLTNDCYSFGLDPSLSFM